MTTPPRITLAGYQGPTSVHTRGLKAFRDALAGQVEVVLRPNVGPDGTKSADLPACVEAGEFDGCYIASSYLAARVPALALFDMPFAAPSRARALELVDGELGAHFAQAFEAGTGLTLLGVWDNGLRHIATAKRPLRHPDDCKGLVLRTMPNAEHQDIFRALGFEPRFIDATDLSEAVARGKVDAQENPLTNTFNFDLHGPLPVITLTGHLMGIAVFVFNTKRLKALSCNIQAAIRAAAKTATQTQRALALQEDASATAALEAAGAKLVSLTEEEADAWRQAAGFTVATCRAKHDPALMAMFDAQTTEAHA